MGKSYNLYKIANGFYVFFLILADISKNKQYIISETFI